MKAVILAAGLGTRLKPLTNRTPKPMLRLNGKPILEYTIRSFPKEVTDIILVVHYRRHQIKQYFKTRFLGKRIHYVYQPKLIGNWDALLRAQRFLKNEKRFFVSYADDLYSAADIRKMLRYSRALLVTQSKNPERYGVVKTDTKGYVASIIEKPKIYVGRLINVGVYILGPEFFKLPMRKEKDHKEYYLAFAVGELAKKRKIKAIRTNFWFPIGYREDLEKAKKLVKKLNI